MILIKHGLFYLRVKKLSHILLETIGEYGCSLRKLVVWDSTLEEGLIESHSSCLR